jgi:hypothetical protein
LNAADESAPGAQIPREARLIEDRDWTEQPVDISDVGVPSRKFSWLSPRTLWRSRNNVLASLSGDPTEHARAAWVEQQRRQLADSGAPKETVEAFRIEGPQHERFSFMVLGDTGEGDRSQYSVVPAFLGAAHGSEFAVIASDVVYPAGDVNEYIEKFFVPYAGYPRPIYAIPGNHDWLDGLAGFMRHFCAAAPPAVKFRPPPRARWSRTAKLVHNVFWRRPTAVRSQTLIRAEQLRGEASKTGPAQPNMYFQIDTPNLRIVMIDAGILGRLDHQQGRWLAEVSAGPKPKLLISGKPVFSGSTASPRRILDPSGVGHSGTLWSIVSDPANNYVAMVSGDIHHYERHAVRLPDGRRMQCVISGGGGAFMSSTHQIARVARPDVGERDWVVFPTRGDSLRAYSISLERKLARMLPWRSRARPLGIPADEAAAIVAERHGLEVADELARGAGSGTAPVRVSRRSRRLAALIYPRRGWFSPGKISEALDWDDPPLFKNFMRVNVDPDGVELVAYGVTGLARDAAGPAVIDRVRIATTGSEQGS